MKHLENLKNRIRSGQYQVGTRGIAHKMAFLMHEKLVLLEAKPVETLNGHEKREIERLRSMRRVLR